VRAALDHRLRRTALGAMRAATFVERNQSAAEATARRGGGRG
jgi:hypothetical protein